VLVHSGNYKKNSGKNGFRLIKSFSQTKIKAYPHTLLVIHASTKQLTSPRHV